MLEEEDVASLEDAAATASQYSASLEVWCAKTSMRSTSSQKVALICFDLL